MRVLAPPESSPAVFLGIRDVRILLKELFYAIHKHWQTINKFNENLHNINLLQILRVIILGV